MHKLSFLSGFSLVGVSFNWCGRVHMYILMYMSIYVYMYLYVYIVVVRLFFDECGIQLMCLSVYIYICMYIYTCLYMYIYVYIHEYMSLRCDGCGFQL